MKSNWMYFVTLFVGMVTHACSDNSAIEKTIDVPQPETRTELGEFMSQRELNSWDRRNYTMEQLFSKFNELKKNYGDDRSARTTRYFIIAEIVERGDYPDDKIVFLLDELETYGMSYPKECYLLLEEAGKRKVMSETQIKEYGERIYQKALTHAYIHEEMLKGRAAPDPSDFSYEAGVYRMYHIREVFTKKMEQYAPEVK